MVTENQTPIKTIKLEYPFEFGKEEITEVHVMRRPKAKDMKGINLQEMTADAQCKLLGRITNLMTPVIEEFDLADFKTLSEAVADFLPSGLESGETD